MGNYIKSISLNIHGGILAGTMEFRPHLNLISGENGTLKTRILHALKVGPVNTAVPGQAPIIQTISPKRNSERRAAEAIVQQFRQNNRTFDTFVNERLSAQINDATFENYSSVGELYYLVFDQRARDGENRKERMLEVTREFNEVIQAIFEHYELLAEWKAEIGAPRIWMRKHGRTEFPLEQLSLGEQEILSLAANLYFGKDRTDIFLIDEPEVHLNWHLEERLFAFLDNLCETYDKQAVVVTHSRVIFTPRFYPKSQFLYWTLEGKVAWGNQLTPEQHRRLAGEAIEIIRLGDFSKPTFFVEDDAHVQIVEALAKQLSVTISVTQCGNSSNVKSLYVHAKQEGGLQNAYFLIDGDNEGNPYPGDPVFIHLPVYCIENYFLDPERIASVAGRTVDDIKQILVSIIKTKRTAILKKNRFFEFLVDGLDATHMTHDRLNKLDASLILPGLVESLSMNRQQFVESYLKSLTASGHLATVFPAPLLTAMRGSSPVS